MERVQYDTNNLEHASEKVWKNYYYLLQQSTQRSEEIQRVKDVPIMDFSKKWTNKNQDHHPQHDIGHHDQIQQSAISNQRNIIWEELKYQSQPALRKSLSFWAKFLASERNSLLRIEHYLGIPGNEINDLRRLQNSGHNRQEKQLIKNRKLSDTSSDSTFENDDPNIILDEMLAVNDCYKKVQIKLQKCLIKYEAIKEQIAKAEVAIPICSEHIRAACPVCPIDLHIPKLAIDWRFIEILINKNHPSLIMNGDFLQYLRQHYGQQLIAQKQEEYGSISIQVSKVLKIFGAFYLDCVSLQDSRSVLEGLTPYRLQTLEEFMSTYQNNPDYSKLRFIVFSFGLSEKLAFDWYIQNKMIIQLLRIQIRLLPTKKEESKKEINYIQEIQDMKQKHALELVSTMMLARERQETPVKVDMIRFTIPDNKYKGYSFDDFKDPKKEESFKKEIELRLRELYLVPKDATITILVSKGSIKVTCLVHYLNILAARDLLPQPNINENIQEQLNARDVRVVRGIPYREFENNDFYLERMEYTWLDSISGYFSATGPPDDRQWYSVPGNPWTKFLLNIRNFRKYRGQNQNWYRSGKITGAWIQGYYCPYNMTIELINFIIKERILPFTTFNPYNFREPQIGQYFYPGIYLYQNLKAIVQKCPSFILGNVSYRVAFSCRINPEYMDIQKSKGLKIYYTFDSEYVRPTAVLIRPIE